MCTDNKTIRDCRSQVLLLGVPGGLALPVVGEIAVIEEVDLVVVVEVGREVIGVM